MEKSDSIKNIATAILKFQGLVGKINKDSNNPFYKSAYASLPDILSAIQQPMIEAGLVLNQFPTGTHGLTTILTHAESGEFMSATYDMIPVKNDPQSHGSSITYQRRYAVGAVLNLNIDVDDDGNSASEPQGNTNQSTNTHPTDDKPQLPWLNEEDKLYPAIEKAVKEGKRTVSDLRKTYAISKVMADKLTALIPKA